MEGLGMLLAAEEIKGVKARYCRYIDMKDWDGYGGLFTSDALMDVSQDTGAAPISGTAAILEQVRFALDNAVSCHHVHTPEISFDGPDNATGIWAMQDRVVWQEGKSPIEGVASITGFGQYHETYKRSAGGWKIASLRLTRFHVDMHAD